MQGFQKHSGMFGQMLDQSKFGRRDLHLAGDGLCPEAMPSFRPSRALPSSRKRRTRRSRCSKRPGVQNVNLPWVGPVQI